MSYVPPIVYADHIGGVAYLLGWVKMPVADGGGWGARIAWAEVDDDGVKLKGGTTPADQVRQIDGQDYSTVPRDPRPRDPSDPRSHDRKRRPQDEAYMEELSRRNHDPEYEERMRRMDGDF